MNKRHVIYHDSCMDGSAAAYIAEKASPSETLVFHPVQYVKGSDSVPVPDGIANRDVVTIVDFSYPLITLQRIRDIGTFVTQLDHHASAFESWSDKLSPVTGNDQNNFYEYSEEGIHVLFCLEMSGAELASVWFQMPRPWWITHVADRDLGRVFRGEGDPDSSVVCASLRARGVDLAAFRRTVDEDVPHKDAAIREGNLLLEMTKREAVTAASRAELITYPWDPDEVIAFPIVNATTLISEVGVAMLDRFPEARVSCSYFILSNKDHDVVLNFRARDGKSALLLAKHFGGGGHPDAAGATVPFDRFSALIRADD